MIHKLVQRGFKVAVIDQLAVKTRSASAQVVVPRALSRLVTPATYTPLTQDGDLDPFSGDPNTAGMLMSLAIHEYQHASSPGIASASSVSTAPRRDRVACATAVGATLFSIRDLKMVSAGLLTRPGWLQKLRCVRFALSLAEF